MPLRNRNYLSDLAGAKDASTKSKYSSLISRLWVLPRAWCVTTSLPAKGVPRHKLAALVRLHLDRLAPFADYGVYACRSADWVHLWFWENQRVRAICDKQGLDFSVLQCAPESVCFPKIRDGAILYRCVEGVEAQLWHSGALLDSAWWPGEIDLATWQAWRPTAAASSGPRSQIAVWPEFLPSTSPRIPNVDNASSLSRPWGRNLLGEPWWRGLTGIRIDMVYVAISCLLLGFAGYLSAQWWSLQRAEIVVEKKIDTLSPRIDPVQSARSNALAQQEWVNQLAKLRNQDGVDQILDSLQPVLQKQDAALREFEYFAGEIRMTVVPINTEIDIVELTKDMEALPRFSNLRLLPDSDSHVMKISGKVRSLTNVAIVDAADRQAATTTTFRNRDQSGKGQ